MNRRSALSVATLSLTIAIGLMGAAGAQQQPAATAQPQPPQTPQISGAQVDRPADAAAAAPAGPATDAAARDSAVLGTPGDPPDSRHVGYYYPPITSTETYVARVDTMPGVDRSKRVGFATLIARGLLNAPYRPPYTVFAKGNDADKMIVVGMVDGELNTIYRIRGLLANLTTQSRLTQVFQENTVAENATFLDFLKMFGYRQLTVTDGVRLTHQITIR